MLLGEAGFEPLGFVVGSSIYHIGIQVARWGQNQELQVLTQAMYNARELAMSRMQAEAEHLGADGIVGVPLRMQAYVWGQDVLEFLATGTAVKAIGSSPARIARPTAGRSPPTSRRRTSSACCAGGAVPVSFVLGTCVYHIAHQSVMQSLRQAGQNQEMPQFTQGIYEARELALARMQAEANAGAGGGDRRRQGRGLQPRLGRARDGVPRHGHRDPPARRRASAAGHLAQTDVHADARLVAARSISRAITRRWISFVPS